MVGGHESQNDSNTTATSSLALASAVSVEWECVPPLWNVSIDTQCIGVIEAQNQKIKHLQAELGEYNHIQYRTLPAYASKGKNVLCVFLSSGYEGGYC